MIYFKSHQIEIHRKRNISGFKYAYSATGTVQDIDLQPMEVDRVNMVEGRIGKTYEGYMDASIDVNEGDILKITDTSKRYTVRSVSTYESAGLLDHHYLILMSED